LRDKAISVDFEDADSFGDLDRDRDFGTLGYEFGVGRWDGDWGRKDGGDCSKSSENSEETHDGFERVWCSKRRWCAGQRD
jgi:hypothetical protein